MMVPSLPGNDPGGTAPACVSIVGQGDGLTGRRGGRWDKRAEDRLSKNDLISSHFSQIHKARTEVAAYFPLAKRAAM